MTPAAARVTGGGRGPARPDGAVRPPTEPGTRSRDRDGRQPFAGDAGVAAPLVLAMASVLALVGLVLASLAAVAVARQRAASAADLSAIAAAQSALEGEGTACARAVALARRVEAALLSCRLDGDVAEVVAAVRPDGPLGRLGTATSQARAGPGEVTASAFLPSG